MNLTAPVIRAARGMARVPAVIVLAATLALALTPGAVAAANNGMPRPEAMRGPDSLAEASAAYAMGETTVRVRERQQLYRFSTTTASVTSQRQVDFGLGAIFESPGTLDRFGDRNYIQITSGPYEGWWVAATGATPSSMTRYSTPKALKFSARDYIGVRFYSQTNVRSRVAVTLASSTTYHADRKATFSGRNFYHITDGPLGGRWVNARAVTLADNDSGGSVTPPPVDPVATWKGIVLFYDETDVTYKRADGSTYHMTANMTSSMKALALDTIGRFDASVPNWSGGLAAIDLDIVHVPHAITSLDTLGTRYWVGPRSVQADIDAYAPAGKYDSVFVVWEHQDEFGEKIPVGGWGLTLPPGDWANGAGYSSIITPSQEWWWSSSSAPQGVFVHEWMHQVIFFMEQQGYPDFDLHATAEYGYEKVDGTWKEWLSDVMQGKVWDGSKYIGVNAEMWASGTPRNP